jgi:hypothetical protein
MAPAVYTYDDLSQRLHQKNPDACRMAVRRLIAKQGFPRPVPGLPGLFPRYEVDQWLEARGCLPPAPQAIIPANDDGPSLPLHLLNSQLEKAYAN